MKKGNPVLIPNGRWVILNASHATPAYYSAYEELCKQITNTGAIMLVLAWWNGASDTPDWWATQGYPRWISVGATDQSANIASFSDFWERVTTYFKWENMKGLSLGGAWPDDNWNNWTSFSAPWVAGLVNNDLEFGMRSIKNESGRFESVDTS